MKQIAQFLIVMVLMPLAAWSQQEAFQATTGYFTLDFTPYSQNQTVPAIVWEEPRTDNFLSKSRAITLKVVVNSETALDIIDVYVNDQTARNLRGFKVVKAQNASEFKNEIDTELLLMPGENEIKITAKDINGNTATSKRNVLVDMNEMMANIVRRKDKALMFAINEYDHWDDLVNPVNDARTIKTELEQYYGFEVELIENPTKKEVLQALRKYAKMTFGENDQLFIFFAGHGHFDQYFNQGYLVCQDTRKDDEEKLTYISHSNFRDIVNFIPCKHIFLSIDACFGGTFDPLIATGTHRGGPDDPYKELNKMEFINRKMRFKTRMFLTSGGKEYVSDGRPGQHSPFARKLIEALRYYGGSDQILTLNEIKNFVEKINPEPRFGEFGNNEPGSDFIFVVQDPM